MTLKKNKQTLQTAIAQELQRLLTQDETIIHSINQLIQHHLSQLGIAYPSSASSESQPLTHPATAISTPPQAPSTILEETNRLLVLLELEKWFRARPYLFSGFLRQPTVVTPQEMETILQRAAQEKLLSSTEITALGSASMLIKGKSEEGDEEHILIIQLSLNAETRDVERAFELATYLRKIGIKAAPLVAAKTFSPQALQLAKEIRVALLEDVFPFGS